MQRLPAGQRPMNNPLTNQYLTGDGRWIGMSCLQAFYYWPGACRALGREDLIEDPRFATHEDLTANAREAAAILKEVFLHPDGRAVAGAAAGLPRPVDTDAGHRGPGRRPDGGGKRVPRAGATPPAGPRSRWSRRPSSSTGSPRRPSAPPSYNEHGDGILTDLLGYDWDAVIDLKVKGAVG